MGLRVILVQADHKTAQTLARFFTERGDEVWIAWDLGQATALMQQVMPDLMMLDLHFPGDDWQNFIRQTHSTYSNLKIIITNKRPDLQREIIARQCGARVYLRQPFTRRWFLNALAAVETGNSPVANPAPLLHVHMPLQIKIILPYLILVLVFGMFGILELGGQAWVFALVAGAILLVVAIGVYLANRITKPLKHLVQASSQVAEGNLEVKVDVGGKDEIAALAHSFNFMVASLQEGLIFRDLLERTVSPDARQQLQRAFSSGDLRLEGQEAVATILVSDIREFTALSEGSDAIRIFDWLNEYFDLLTPILINYGGVVNKIDGDKMTAFFGIMPSLLPPQESARQACQAALEMLQAIEELNLRRARRGDVAMHTGIGINTGLLAAGGLGTADRLHYTIVGDTVNTTHRLESTTRDLFTASGIVISQATFNALGKHTSDFRLDPQGLRPVKGKAERIMIYRLLPARAMPELKVML